MSKAILQFKSGKLILFLILRSKIKIEPGTRLIIDSCSVASKYPLARSWGTLGAWVDAV